jgi:hypothetical protein
LAILAYADTATMVEVLDSLEGLDPNVHVRVQAAIGLLNADDDGAPYWAAIAADPQGGSQ